jgi:hypothetical protein
VNAPRRIARTLALRAALSAAAGFLSTIAVAWASAYFYPCPFGASCTPARSAGPLADEHWGGIPPRGEIDRFDTHLASFVSASSPFWLELCTNGWTDEQRASYRARKPDPEPNWQAYVPPWAFNEISAALRCGREQYTEVSFEAHGWPEKSWFFATRRISDRLSHSFQLARGWHIPHWNDSQMTAFRGYGAILPYGPIWPGIALNASLVAVPLFLLTTLAPSLRAALRRRRARCPKCNYDLRGLTASTPRPECGAML